MHTLVATDRLRLIFIVLCLVTCSWQGLAAASLMALMITCRRAVRSRMPAPHGLGQPTRGTT